MGTSGPWNLILVFFFKKELMASVSSLLGPAVPVVPTGAVEDRA